MTLPWRLVIPSINDRVLQKTLVSTESRVAELNQIYPNQLTFTCTPTADY